MAETGQDFTLYTDNDKRPEVTVTDKEDNPVDLEGATIEWVANDTSDGSEIMRKTTDDGGITINDAKYGKFIIKITASDTEGISSDATLSHEARVTLAMGAKTHVVTGTIDLIASNI